MKQLIASLLLIGLATYGLTACNSEGGGKLSHQDSVDIYEAMKNNMTVEGVNNIAGADTLGIQVKTLPEQCDTADVWVRNYQADHAGAIHSYLVKSSEVAKLRLDLNPYMHIFYAQKTVGGPVTLVITALKSDGRHYFFGPKADQVLEYVIPCSPCYDASGATITAPSTLSCP